MRWVLSARERVGNAWGPAGPAPAGAGPRGPVRSEGPKAGRSFDFQTSGSPGVPEKAAFPSYQACVSPRPTDLS